MYGWKKQALVPFLSLCSRTRISPRWSITPTGSTTLFYAATARRVSLRGLTWRYLRGWLLCHVDILIESSPFPSDLGLVRHNGESVERAQGLLHVHVTDAQGLRQGPGLRQGQGAGGVRRPRPPDLPVGRQHTHGAHGVQQHRHQYAASLLPPAQRLWCIVGLVVCFVFMVS